MKSLKPFLFVLAGVAIALLFAFKNEESVKEYCIVTTNVPGAKIFIYKANDEVLKENSYTGAANQSSMTLINKMSLERWKVIGFSTVNNNPAYLLERTKQ